MKYPSHRPVPLPRNISSSSSSSSAPCHKSSPSGTDAGTTSRAAVTLFAAGGLKRGSGAPVNAGERDSARRAQHGSATDNMISAPLGPSLGAAGRYAGIIVRARRAGTQAGLHPPHGSHLFPTDLLQEVAHHAVFPVRLRLWRGFSATLFSGKENLALCGSS